MSDDLVMYLLVREDLGMSPGKIAAQCGHAVQQAIEYALLGTDTTVRDRYAEWRQHAVKVVLRVKDKEHLYVIYDQLSHHGVYVSQVVDEGRTEVPENSVTCASVEPRKKSELAPILGKLKLL